MQKSTRWIDCAVLRSTLAGSMVFAATGSAWAQYEPPAGYYSTATGTGATLQSNLHLIISKNYWIPASTSHLVRSYGDARQGLQLTDADPNNPSRIILFYTANSVNGTWDSGVTWNREHTWPRSRGVDSSGPDNSDMHMLRPCNPSINSSRSNLAFGEGPGYWDPLANIWVPGANHRGESARGMFYAATRYDGGDGNTTNLTLVYGQPSGSQMGDLGRLLEWHYSDPVDTQERRRNHLLFSNSDNPFYYQGNRNPFVDHPEFVWAIWGPSPNDSTLYVGVGPAADGSSTTSASVRAIVGATEATGTLSLFKLGTHPTTFDITPGAGIDVVGSATGNAIPGSALSGTVELVTTGALVPGSTLTQLTIDNSDLTSAGFGMGSADADDTVDVSIDVLTPAVASFESGSQVGQTLVMGEAFENGPVAQIVVPIHNFGWTSLQSALDLDGVAGLSGAFATGAPLPSGITATEGDLVLEFDPSGLSAGTIVQETATLTLSDEDVPGETTHQLTLDLEIEVLDAIVGCDGDADRDGFVSFNDLTSVLSAWGTSPAPGEPGDADGSGFVDFNDLTIVLSNWGGACLP